MPTSDLEISQAEHAKYLGLHLDRETGESTYSAKTTWNSIEQNVLAARQQIATVDRK